MPEPDPIANNATTPTPPPAAGAPPATPPPTADAGATLLGGEVDPWECADWQKNVPEKFRDEKGEIRIKELAKSFSHLEKRIGSAELPPKDADGYKVDVKLPEGVTMGEPELKGFLKACHGAGFTNKQVQFVMDKYSEVLGSFTDQRDKATSDLKTQWGEGYDANIALAQKAYLKLVPEADRGLFQKAGNNPAVIRLLAVLGKDLTEDKIKAGEPSTGNAESIEALMKSPAYWDPKNPDHTRVKNQVKMYFENKYKKAV